MFTEFHIKADELNEEFLMKLKGLFKGDERISITIEEEDETTYLLQSEANRKMIERGMKSADDGNLTEVDLDHYLKGK